MKYLIIIMERKLRIRIVHDIILYDTKRGLGKHTYASCRRDPNGSIKIKRKI